MTIRERIVEKSLARNTGNWGKALNQIQNIAQDVLDDKAFDRYLKKSNKDAKTCDGMDCIVLNGKVFDWKEFRSKADQIIDAYLDYFTNVELQLIYAKL